MKILMTLASFFARKEMFQVQFKKKITLATTISGSQCSIFKNEWFQKLIMNGFEN